MYDFWLLAEFCWALENAVARVCLLSYAFKTAPLGLFQVKSWFAWQTGFLFELSPFLEPSCQLNRSFFDSTLTQGFFPKERRNVFLILVGYHGNPLESWGAKTNPGNNRLPLHPKTMKNEGFKPPKYGL